MYGVNRLLIQLLDGAIELIEVFLEELLGNFCGDDDDYWYNNKAGETGSVISSLVLTLKADSWLGDGDGLTCNDRVFVGTSDHRCSFLVLFPIETFSPSYCLGIFQFMLTK